MVISSFTKLRSKHVMKMMANPMKLNIERMHLILLSIQPNLSNSIDGFFGSTCQKYSALLAERAQNTHRHHVLFCSLPFSFYIKATDA